MTGGTMQLTAYGAQDLYLTANPQITYFKLMYRRYTNFATEYISLPFRTLSNFSLTQRTQVTCDIVRNGDLVSDCYLVFDLPNIFSSEEEGFRWVRNLGENIIYKTQLTIGGEKIDEQYGQWMNVWNQLTLTDGKRKNYDVIIGNTANINNLTRSSDYQGDIEVNNFPNGPSIPATRLYIPFQFAFCLNPGLAIPLISLQYHFVTINIEFTPVNDWYYFVPNFSGETGSLQDPRNIISPKQLFAGTNVNSSLTSDQSQLLQKFQNEGYDYQNIFWKFVNGTTSRGGWNENSFIEANYVYLDADERTQFALYPQEYLFMQVQRRLFQGLLGSNNRLDLDFHNTCKELIWVMQRDDVDSRNDWNNYTFCDFNDLDYPNNLTSTQNYTQICLDDGESGTVCLTQLGDIKGIGPTPTCDSTYSRPNNFSFNNGKNIMYQSTLFLDGLQRYEIKDSVFFNYLIPYKYHSNKPSDGINCYSFALYPEQPQPSGTLNFSRIEKTQMWLALRNVPNDNVKYNCTVFANTYNVLRIYGGMGGIAFAL